MKKFLFSSVLLLTKLANAHLLQVKNYLRGKFHINGTNVLSFKTSLVISLLTII